MKNKSISINWTSIETHYPSLMSSSSQLKGSGTALIAQYLPTLCRCSFSNLKKFHIPRRIISRIATNTVRASLCKKGVGRPNTVSIQASLNKIFKTMAPKYILLCGRRSLSLNQLFLEFLCRSPQSITRSQYVPKTAASAEVIHAIILQWDPLVREKAVLAEIAIIVEKYFNPLSACMPCFSSYKRRRHWRRRNQYGIAATMK